MEEELITDWCMENIQLKEEIVEDASGLSIEVFSDMYDAMLSDETPFIEEMYQESDEALEAGEIVMGDDVDGVCDNFIIKEEIDEVVKNVLSCHQLNGSVDMGLVEKEDIVEVECEIMDNDVAEGLDNYNEEGHDGLFISEAVVNLVEKKEEVIITESEIENVNFVNMSNLMVEAPSRNHVRRNPKRKQHTTDEQNKINIMNESLEPSYVAAVKRRKLKDTINISNTTNSHVEPTKASTRKIKSTVQKSKGQRKSSTVLEEHINNSDVINPTLESSRTSKHPKSKSGEPKSKPKRKRQNGVDREKRFKCDVCGRRFGRRHHLGEHSTVHTGEKNYICKVCGKACRLKSNLNKHLKTHVREKGGHHCNICDKFFIQKNHLSSHLLVHENNKTKVRLVRGKVLDKKSELDNHLLGGLQVPEIESRPKAKTRKKLSVSDTSLSTGELEDKPQKKRELHDYNDEEREGLFMSVPDSLVEKNEEDVENTTFVDMSNLKLQPQKPIAGTRVRCNPKRKQKNTDEQNEVSIINEMLEPSYKTATNCRKLKNPINISNITNSNVEPMKTLTGRQKSRVQKSKEKKKSIAVEERINTSDVINPTLEISRTSKTSKSKSRILKSKSNRKRQSTINYGIDRGQHSTVHTPEKNYICKICGKACKLKSNLTKHLKTHVREKGGHHCNICDKAFIQKNRLSLHLLVHENNKTKVCHVRGKLFDKKSELDNHLLGVLHEPEIGSKVKTRNKQSVSHTSLSKGELEDKSQKKQELDNYNDEEGEGLFMSEADKLVEKKEEDLLLLLITAITCTKVCIGRPFTSHFPYLLFAGWAMLHDPLQHVLRQDFTQTVTIKRFGWPLITWSQTANRAWMMLNYPGTPSRLLNDKLELHGKDIVPPAHCTFTSARNGTVHTPSTAPTPSPGP